MVEINMPWEVKIIGNGENAALGWLKNCQAPTCRTDVGPENNCFKTGRNEILIFVDFVNCRHYVGF